MFAEETGGRAHAEVERFMRSRGIEPRVVFRAEDNHLLQGLAAEGIGAAIIQSWRSIHLET